MALPLVTQSELQSMLAEEADITKAQARDVLVAIENIVNDCIFNCERVKIGGVTIAPAVKKATKARMGRNPQTGEDVPVAAKPASVRIALRAAKPLKDSAPSVQKLKRKLAA